MEKWLPELEKLSSEIFNVSSVLYKYCKEQTEDEEIARICPILELLYKKTDDLNSKLMTLKIN